MTPRKDQPHEDAPAGWHVVRLHTDLDGLTFAETFTFPLERDARAFYARSRNEAESQLHSVRRRAVWLYEINPFDGRRAEVEAWVSDYNEPKMEAGTTDVGRATAASIPASVSARAVLDKVMDTIGS